MREIKFRAWNIRKKKMQEVKGLSFDYCSEMGMKNTEIGVVMGKPYVDDVSIDGYKSLEVANHGKYADTVILEQFTGLKDKNNVPIYEGDIVKYVRKDCEGGGWYSEKEGKGVMEYDTDWGWRLKINDGTQRTADCHMKNFTFKVIGNIHQNSNLLN